MCVAQARTQLQGQLDALAAENGITLAQVQALYNGFATLEPNGDGEVDLGSIRDMLVRVSATPFDDDALMAWMADCEARFEGGTSQ